MVASFFAISPRGGGNLAFRKRTLLTLILDYADLLGCIYKDSTNGPSRCS